MPRKKIKDDRTHLISEDQDAGETSYGSLHHDFVEISEVSNSSQGEQDTANVFSNGHTRIDFVLVWETACRPQEGQGDEGSDSESRGTWWKTHAVLHKFWRKKFLNKLQAIGIRMEKYVAEDKKKAVHYLLLSAPWSVLCYYAEDLSLRLPLQALANQSSNWSARMLRRLGMPNLLAEEVPNLPLDHYTCQFKVNKLQWFLGNKEQDSFFNSTQRHQILREILATTPYGNIEEGQVGVDRLLNEGVFTAAFPLHDGPYKVPPEGLDANTLNQRQILFQYWACWRNWNKYQPLDHIRQYFGEKIAFYFAWLGFYTAWLLPAAVVGTLVFIMGVFMMFDDVPSQEICESEDQFQMCPLCKKCPYWLLSSICSMFMAGRLFDHGGTVFFSIFMTLWAVMFLEYWKRMNATLAHRWDCSDFEDIEERPRPEFVAMAPMTMRNPITGVEEPYFPKRNQIHRILAGSMVIIMMISVVVMFLISIILYRAIVSLLVASSRDFRFVASASRIASLTGSVVNLIFILMLSKIYIALAHFLTKWEMHRTQSKFEDAFTFKVFIFQFVNFYSSPIYIAFFKGRFVGYPGHYGTLFSVRNEECGPGGCLIELAQELLVIMVGKQMINNVQEIVLPKLKGWWQKYNLRSKTTSNEASSAPVPPAPWQSNCELLVPEGLFDEYLEMVLQFGFVTIFVAAFPLAPLFALLNNWAEIRVDAQKFVCEYQRPVAERAQGIGIWFYILEVITNLAVISNAFLIAFTSDFLPRLYYQYTYASNLRGYVNFTLAYAPATFVSQYNITCRYRAFREVTGQYSLIHWNLLAIRLGFIIVFEHVVFFITRLIELMVPDLPESVEIKVKRERYLAKQALAENQVLLEAKGGLSKARTRAAANKDWEAA
ncbi:anoctamin-7 [Alligator mississippiensis]|uniref:Anoctamin n=1 Tax=Alligator mississippiensis TaxID=8496 RepID=A0A151MJX1_ALLMI|nr:anoctamin-7 [Alligator mississippiensis]XP_019355363.1 anoctamin-7 [Alligator mississippiensis]KYO24816.1 anoctamin-5 [Alligator mississippiensis]